MVNERQESKNGSVSVSTTSFVTFLGVILSLSSLSWALQGGAYAPVMDCDETFNYVEALHYLLHGSGMQTWEYAAQYGLRSWFYIELHALPIRLMRLFVPLTKVHELLLVRGSLHFISCILEAYLCSSIQVRFGANSAWLSALLLGLSSGMGHARRAFLPSSTCMMAFTLAQACWLRNKFELGLLAGSFSVLVSWPFSALPYIPIGLHALAKVGFVRVLFIAIISLIMFGMIPAYVDSKFYGKPAWPTVEMVLYNALGRSGGGAHLYGTETWTYYLKNLFLNFNVMFPLSLLAAVFGDEKVRLYHGVPLLLTAVVFQSMEHKEERFLFILYPTLCWSAAVIASPIRTRPIWSSFRVIVLVLVVAGLSLSRDMSLNRLSAPARVYEQLNNMKLRHHVNLCVGREWHRFPSSFYLPESVELKWTKSSFSGILPQPFAAKDENGYSRIVPHVNDMNVEEPSRYLSPQLCDMTVDVDEPYDSGDALQISNDEWQVVGMCSDFSDLQTSAQPYRSFAWPPDPWRGVSKRRYCLYGRKAKA